MNEPAAEGCEIVDMTPAEEAWVMWATSCDVDTGGRCECGHEGLGVDWHLSDCPGAVHALAGPHPPRPAP